MSRRLAIIGLGKMGRAVSHLARERGWDVVAEIARGSGAEGRPIDREQLANADIAVEFTIPDAAVANVRAVVEAGCPIVVGTTGWYGQLPELSDWVKSRGGAMLAGPNFSIGVNIFERVVEFTATLMRDIPAFDAHLVETHHAAKKDAPSGTAITLAAAAGRGLARAIPSTSIRIGSVPGTHELLFDAAFEQIRLEHVARDRRVFAEGALVAAGWLIGKRGVFTMRDVLIPLPSDGSS